MCKLYNQERRIWKHMGLILDNKCTLEVACQDLHDETNCSCAETCKEVNKDLETWLKEKHKKRGKN